MAQLEGDAKQEYVAELFARIARRYDLMNDLMTLGQHRRWKRQTARLTAQGLPKDIHVMSLDIATGTGDLARELALQPGVQQSIGLDLLPEMISIGLAKTRAQGLCAKTTFILGDALRLPFPDGSISCATAGFSLRNMPDLKAALTEMVRVVKPGGRITTLELSPMPGGNKYWLSRILFRVFFHRLVPLIGQLISGDRSAYTYLPQSVDYFLEADRLAGLFQELGLINVGYKRMGMGTVALHWGQRPP